MVETVGLFKDYKVGKVLFPALRGIDMHIGDGEFTAIAGPSGSGKTTLLNIIGCLDVPTKGEVIIDNINVNTLTSKDKAKLRKEHIGFVFQTFNLLPRLTALANVELGMRYCGGSDRDKAMMALDKVGLSDRMKHRPVELSGGEQQRVAIARALVKNPLIILADEPTGNLDSHSGEEIISILTTLHAEKTITLVLITHDLGIARHCQRIIRLKDGRVVKEERL